MNKDTPIIEPTENMIQAYEKILKFSLDEIKLLENKTGPALHKLIDSGSQKLHELEELTEHEAQNISDYLKRDLTEAATYMSETGEDFNKWLALDTEILEDYILDLFKQAADQTTVQLNQINFAGQAAQYHTGEITGPGVLRCDQCGEELHFEKTGHIPPCPKCKATVYHRLFSR